MKKRLLIALAVVLLLSLAGCGKSEKKAGLANKDIIGIWQCTAALESMDSYSKFYEEAKDIYNETYSSVPNVLTLEKSGKASYYILDYQYYGKWKLKGKTVTFTVEDSKSVVEGANDLLPAGSTIKFKIDKKNMRITREFEPRGVFVYERNQ